MTDEVRFLKKKFLEARNGSKSGPKWFVEIEFFVEIEYNDSLQQFLTSSRKPMKKLGEKIGWKNWSKQPKSDSKLCFLSYSQDLFVSFSLCCIG